MLHTLNLRLFPEQLTYIVNHAEDEVIFVDRSLLGLLVPRIGELPTVKHLVEMCIRDRSPGFVWFPCPTVAAVSMLSTAASGRTMLRGSGTAAR